MSYSGGRILLSSQRESQVSRFRPWIMVALPLAAILFQVYVPLFFPFLAFLETPLLVVVYFALMRRSQVAGLLAGALVLSRALLAKTLAFDPQRTLVMAALNAVVGVALYHFLDKLRESA